MSRTSNRINTGGLPCKTYSKSSLNISSSSQTGTIDLWGEKKPSHYDGSKDSQF
jgi:hypothetical protein